MHLIWKSPIRESCAQKGLQIPLSIVIPGQMATPAIPLHA